MRTVHHFPVDRVVAAVVLRAVPVVVAPKLVAEPVQPQEVELVEQLTERMDWASKVAFVVPVC